MKPTIKSRGLLCSFLGFAFTHCLDVDIIWIACTWFLSILNIYFLSSILMSTDGDTDWGLLKYNQFSIIKLNLKFLKNNFSDKCSDSGTNNNVEGSIDAVKKRFKVCTRDLFFWFFSWNHYLGKEGNVGRKIKHKKKTESRGCESKKKKKGKKEWDNIKILLLSLTFNH